MPYGDDLSEMERSMLFGIRLLSEDAREEVMRIIAYKIRDTRRKNRAHGLPIKNELL